MSYHTTRPLAASVGALLAAVILAMPAGQGPDAQGGQPRVNQDARLSADFLRRVQHYMAIHEKAKRQLRPSAAGATSPEPEADRALARAIARARPRAEHGDVFTREGRGYFRRQIAGALSGPDGTELRASIMDDNPGPRRIRVNDRYPDSAPLSTMPPQVLAALPKLPAELEYRVLGDRLILLDVHSHLIVDYIDRALPK